MIYIGHKREDGKIQPLAEHLMGVGEMAAKFADSFGAGKHAERTGLLHDVGKYGENAQRRQRDPENVPKVDHSTAGALEAFALRDLFAAFSIAGHHGGLKNLGSMKSATPSDGTLCGRLKKQLDDNCSLWKEDISIDGRASVVPAWLNSADNYARGFYTRMLFSCLVDADYLDTEAFMQDEAAPRGGGASLDVLFFRLKKHVEPWLSPGPGEETTALNRKRSDILTKCLAGDWFERGLYTMTVPTGGGKTISSLAFALSHAVEHGLSRVIYVAPYTSIIEQNAQVYAEIVGADNVIEHHSNVDFKDDVDDAASDRERRRQLATENWDAPIVVTTAVQFFESLHGARTSQCRKLHNLSNSVILLDEAQMIPIAYLRPCVAALSELVRHYGATVVLLTATQPALTDLFREFAPELAVREVCDDVAGLYDFFKRVHFIHEGTQSEATLAERLNEADQVLCIVNSRKRAQNLYALLKEDCRFHLSTLMTPAHRRAVIAEVKRRLKAGESVRLVSTSLIEAGVDVDFPSVWREEAGLDSILQAAGRCNREGGRPADDSLVHVFTCEGAVPPMFRQQVGATHTAMDAHESFDGLDSIETYFKALYKFAGRSVDKRDILALLKELAFADVAASFKLIDQDTVTIYIPTDENARDIDMLRRGQLSRALMRRLGQNAISVFRPHYTALYAIGKLELTPDGLSILADETQYSQCTGLSLDADAGAALFV